MRMKWPWTPWNILDHLSTVFITGAFVLYSVHRSGELPAMDQVRVFAFFGIGAALLRRFLTTPPLVLFREDVECEVLFDAKEAKDSVEEAIRKAHAAIDADAQQNHR